MQPHEHHEHLVDRLTTKLCQCVWCNGFITGTPHKITRGTETFTFHRPVDRTKPEEEQKSQRHCARNWEEMEQRVEKSANGTL